MNIDELIKTGLASGLTMRIDKGRLILRGYSRLESQVKILLAQEAEVLAALTKAKQVLQELRAGGYEIHAIGYNRLRFHPEPPEELFTKLRPQKGSLIAVVRAETPDIFQRFHDLDEDSPPEPGHDSKAIVSPPEPSTLAGSPTQDQDGGDCQANFQIPCSWDNEYRLYRGLLQQRLRSCQDTEVRAIIQDLNTAPSPANEEGWLQLGKRWLDVTYQLYQEGRLPGWLWPKEADGQSQPESCPLNKVSDCSPGQSKDCHPEPDQAAQHESQVAGANQPDKRVALAVQVLQDNPDPISLGAILKKDEIWKGIVVPHNWNDYQGWVFVTPTAQEAAALLSVDICAIAPTDPECGIRPVADRLLSMLAAAPEPRYKREFFVVGQPHWAHQVARALQDAGIPYPLWTSPPAGHLECRTWLQARIHQVTDNAGLRDLGDKLAGELERKAEDPDKDYPTTTLDKPLVEEEPLWKYLSPSARKREDIDQDERSAADMAVRANAVGDQEGVRHWVTKGIAISRIVEERNRAICQFTGAIKNRMCMEAKEADRSFPGYLAEGWGQDEAKLAEKLRVIWLSALKTIMSPISYERFSPEDLVDPLIVPDLGWKYKEYLSPAAKNRGMIYPEEKDAALEVHRAIESGDMEKARLWVEEGCIISQVLDERENAIWELVRPFIQRCKK